MSIMCWHQATVAVPIQVVSGVRHPVLALNSVPPSKGFIQSLLCNFIVLFVYSLCVYHRCPIACGHYMSRELNVRGLHHSYQTWPWLVHTDVRCIHTHNNYSHNNTTARKLLHKNVSAVTVHCFTQTIVPATSLSVSLESF